MQANSAAGAIVICSLIQVPAKPIRYRCRWKLSAPSDPLVRDRTTVAGRLQSGKTTIHLRPGAHPDRSTPPLGSINNTQALSVHCYRPAAIVALDHHRGHPFTCEEELGR